jgi:hypothetical protein
VFLPEKKKLYEDVKFVSRRSLLAHTREGLDSRNYAETEAGQMLGPY